MWAEFEEIQKHLLTGIHHVGGYTPDTERVTFFCNDGYAVTLYHSVDCCETVRLEDDDGLTNGVDIFTGCKWCEVNKSVMGKKNNEDYGDEQWTFYLFMTDKGYDTMRWYGESNGYYSVDVAYDVGTWNDQPFYPDDREPKFEEEYPGQKAELKNALMLWKEFCQEHMYADCEECPFVENGECYFAYRDRPSLWTTPESLYEEEDEE